MPAPLRSSASVYLGPVIGKINYAQLPPSNQQTDFDNTMRTYAYCDTAALLQTADRVAFQFTTASSTGGLVLNAYFAQWIVVSPTLPVMSRVSTGVFSFTFPTMVSDEYDAAFNITNNLPVSLTGGTGNMAAIPAFVCVSASVNVVTVSLFDNTNTPQDFAGNIVNVRAF